MLRTTGRPRHGLIVAKRFVWMAAAVRVLFAAFLIGVIGPRDAVSAPPPNFVVIMADDMGYGDSSVYDGWVKTPQLERMAEEGLLFTDFHSSGVVCSPTRAGLLTGRYQWRAGIGPGVVNADPGKAVHYHGLQPEEITFAELLKEAGYTTGIFGKWHLGYQKKYNPIHQGFDEFIGFVSGNIDYVSHYDRMEIYDWWHGLEKVKEEGYLTELLTDHAVRFIQEHASSPFCLYLPHGAVHSPIQAPGDPPVRGPNAKKPGYKQPGRSRRETAREMVKALDRSVGRVLDALEAQGLAERTLVFFFSDNGNAGHLESGPLRGSKGNVWEGGHRVPAIAWWPGKIPAGERTDALTISLDLMPTMLDLADVSPSENRLLDGASLADLLLEGKPLGRRELFWEGEAMREGPWKLVLEAPGLTDPPGLFHLGKDLAERNNVAAAHPERVKRMKKAIKAWREEMRRTATKQPSPSKEFLRKAEKRLKTR